MVVDVLFVLFLLAPSLVIVTYYLSLVAARLLGVHDAREPAATPIHKFLIIIPAHDEELVIEETIRSCHQLDYPRHLFDVTVIADNCRDGTVQLAQTHGTKCLVRDEPNFPGKGSALAWALPQMMKSDHDAYMVLDADCPLDRRALAVMDRFLQDGDYVLQANHDVANADVSPISYAASVGRILEYDLFFAPKSRLGMAVILVGTGMVFHRTVLENLPWTSESCAEDTEYTLDLYRRGLRVRFVSNALIRCSSAETGQELKIQRTRWASGNLSLGKSNTPRLISEGLRTANLRLLDLGWTLLILSRPLVLLHLGAVQLTAWLIYLLRPDAQSRMLVCAASVLLLLFAVYLSIGVMRLGLNPLRLRFLLAAPVVVVRMASISLLALLGLSSTSWTRTPRRS